MDREEVIAPSSTPPHPVSPPRTVNIDVDPTPDAVEPEIVATEPIVSTAAIEVTTPAALPRVSVTYDNSASRYKSAVKHVYTYFYGFLPRHVPLCRVAFFSTELIRWATLITSELNAALALCCVSEEQLVFAMGFLKVSRNFLRINPALPLADPNVALALDTLGMAVERCAKFLAHQSAPIVGVQSTRAPMLLLERYEGPALPTAPEVNEPADATPFDVDATQAVPTLTVRAGITDVVTVDDTTDDKFAVDITAVDTIDVSLGASSGKKKFAPRAPYVLSRGPPGGPCPLGDIRSFKANKSFNHAPPGLAMEKRSPGEVAAAFAAYYETLDSVFCASSDYDSAFPDGFAESLKDENTSSGDLASLERFNNVEAEKKQEIKIKTRVSVFDRLGPVASASIDASNNTSRKSVLDRLGPIPSTVDLSSVKVSPPCARISVLKHSGSGNSGSTSGNATPLSSAGDVVSVSLAATEVAAAKKKVRRGKGYGRRHN